MKSFLFFIVLFCILPNAIAQVGKEVKRIPHDRFNEKWEEYRYRSKSDVRLLERLYFKDTVSVTEMKEAFRTSRDRRFLSSPYAGLDSVRGVGCEKALLTSPLRRHPVKQVRSKRGVWASGIRFFLCQLLDKDGMSQDALLEGLNKSRDSLVWLDGDFVTLRSPRHYMGFVVSPCPGMESYSHGRLVGQCGKEHCPLDFFSSAGPSRWMDGDWYHKAEGGAQLMSQLLTLYTDYPNVMAQERTFCVLLYEKVGGRYSNREYTLELLSPAEPDEATSEAFNTMRRFVEALRYNAFNPLYTTDMRIMTGRFYRVTVNKCGWLVEDYLDINNKRTDINSDDKEYTIHR